MNDISKTDFVPAEIEAQPPEGELESPAEKVLPTPQFESEKIFPLTAPVTRTVKGNPEVVTHVRLRAPIAMDVFEIGGSVSKTIWNPAGMIIEMDTERLKKFIGRECNFVGTSEECLGTEPLSARLPRCCGRHKALLLYSQSVLVFGAS